ncbi:hypothetical protein [Dongia sp.]|uniref:hypothetical protein n=1 Tax=Dongia sp. TaxID=1977262 RepID=UPI0035AFC850
MEIVILLLPVVVDAPVFRLGSVEAYGAAGNAVQYQFKASQFIQVIAWTFKKWLMIKCRHLLAVQAGRALGT